MALTALRQGTSLAKRTAVTDSDIKGALEDFIPPSYPTEIDLQNIVAVLECTSKSLLPKKYHGNVLVCDPANNLIEFKHYRDPRMMY